MKKNKKYPFGGTVDDPVWDYLMLKQQRGSSLPNTIENPNTALADNQTRLARAELKSNNGLTKGLDILGALGMKLGTSMMSQGISNGEGADGKGVAGFLNKNSDMFNTLLNGLAGASSFAKGGRINQGDVEVEGGEMFETPEGQVGQFNGPNHENGGIPLKVKKRGVVKDDEVPDGTFIYSDRTKIGNKTIADRKKQRDNKEKSIEKILGDSSDMILKNTLNRVKELNLEQDALDRFVQESTKNIKETKKFGVGGLIDDKKGYSRNNVYYQTPEWMQVAKSLMGQPEFDISKVEEFKRNMPIYDNASLDNGISDSETTQEMGKRLSTPFQQKENNEITTNQQSEKFNTNTEGFPTFGDAIGIFGNLYQGYKPLENTLTQRAGDTPNINPYENYGKEALTTLQNSKQNLAGIFDEQEKDLQLARNTSIMRNRNSARGINTQRALDIATDTGFNSAENDLLAKELQAIMGIEGNIANAQLDISGKKASGEQYRDVSDRQDRDAFYSNLAKDYVGVGEAVSRTGKALNQIKERDVKGDFMNMLFDNVEGNFMTGKVSQKQNLFGRDINSQIKDFDSKEGYKSFGISKEDWKTLPKETQIQLFLKYKLSN